MKKNGFTLIELLVVISIIAVLLSILMPALNSAKAKARIVVCSSNFHQLGIATIAYATNNDDKLVKAPFMHITCYSHDSPVYVASVYT